ncbi:MAG: hypothetical protein F4120_02610 [Rhodothermaceae bacterium]|nr:hypothetical protein [Bacteroidota bacterium]MXW14342.1 hypothetical protein [Rhodothermaceae bacterium]MYC05305.1 hypothetical protein [Rhodothermaceae bacterium]MYI16500.1 hypothetical protein [Rhodothermaceae bacterium]
MFRQLPLLLLLVAPMSYGQGVMQPLSIQGLERQELMTARARGMGSAVTALSGSIESAILNPAGLASLSRPTFSTSGAWFRQDWAETQHWNPNRYYAGMSLYFADPEDYRSEPLSEPDWTYNQSSLRLATMAGAVPLEVGDQTLTLGIVFHQIAQLSDYDRNDNVLDPYIGQFRPDPIERPKPGEEIPVQWSAFERERTGHLQAVSSSVGFELHESFHVGLRVSRIWGSSTDRQHTRNVGMFLLREDAHDYSYEAATGSLAWDGSSEYSGWRGVFGMQWQYDMITVGVTYQFASNLRQKFTNMGREQTQESGARNHTQVGEHQVEIPARIGTGVVLRPIPSIVLAADYFWQNFSDLKVLGSAMGSGPDWGMVQGIGLGAEWNLHGATFLRAGFRRDPQPFRIEGFGLVGQTATGDAFSVGLGTSISILTLDLAYEFQNLHYQDRWESNVDYNRVRKHSVLVGVTYAL